MSLFPKSSSSSSPCVIHSSSSYTSSSPASRTALPHSHTGVCATATMGRSSKSFVSKPLPPLRAAALASIRPVLLSRARNSSALRLRRSRPRGRVARPPHSCQGLRVLKREYRPVDNQKSWSLLADACKRITLSYQTHTCREPDLSLCGPRVWTIDTGINRIWALCIREPSELFQNFLLLSR